MIQKDLIIDFEKKKISLKKPSSKVYTAQQLYSYLMDLFDEPENMKHDIPIMARSKTDFVMVNGWKLDPAAKKFLNGHISQG